MKLIFTIDVKQGLKFYSHNGKPYQDSLVKENKVCLTCNQLLETLNRTMCNVQFTKFGLFFIQANIREMLTNSKEELTATTSVLLDNILSGKYTSGVSSEEIIQNNIQKIKCLYNKDIAMGLLDIPMDELLPHLYPYIK